jgi:hypothetical protein
METATSTGAPSEATSMLVRSRAAFLRDLPELLANPKYDRWCAAYHGDERIGIAKSHIDLIKECKRRGLQRDQYYVGCIFPQSDGEEEIDTGYYEFDDIEFSVTDILLSDKKQLP